MIRVERKRTDKAQKAIEALEKARKTDSGYNTPEVNAALREMFHGKCYICENKEATSYQIEHLAAHRGNLNLKYDWQNLFWACAHCNNTKLDRFEPILDCTKEDIEAAIAFRKKGYFGTDEELLFEPLDDREATLNTGQLLREVYYGTTPQKKIEAAILRKQLRKEIAEFKRYVRDYKEAEDEEKEDLKCLLKRELGDASPFAAFKRWLIRDNKESYPELRLYFS